LYTFMNNKYIFFFIMIYLGLIILIFLYLFWNNIQFNRVCSHL